jgi:hypothetical protein
MDEVQKNTFTDYKRTIVRTLQTSDTLMFLHCRQSNSDFKNDH